MKTIAKTRIAIEKKIAKLKDELTVLQESCSHENAIHVNRANTGNYDPSCDSYWTEHTCPDCSKNWTTDQDWGRK